MFLNPSTIIIHLVTYPANNDDRYCGGLEVS